MADYERTVTVTTAPDAAFRFLTDPSNLPRYIATMVLAEPKEDEQLRVAAEVQGRHEEGDARVQVDSTVRRMDWSAQSESGYRGWLQVSPSGEGSAVTVHIHVARDEDEAEINRVLDETLANAERLLAS